MQDLSAIANPAKFHTAGAGDGPASRPQLNRNPGDDGYAIIVVLAMLSLFALVAVGLQKTVVVDVRLASNLAHRARAEALADGITRLAIRHLILNAPVNGRSGPFRLDGVPLTCRAGASVVSISFVNVDGQINLNGASEALLIRLLGGVGLAEKEATLMAHNILDFRTDGDLSIAGGSKLDIYSQAGLRHGPKNAPFQSVGELDQVVGMTRSLLERLRPLMTVHSRLGVLNPTLMSRPVAMALAGGSSSLVQDLDRLRASLVLPAEWTFMPRGGRGPINTASFTYLVHVSIQRGGTERFTRATVVDMGAREQGGATIKEWIELDTNGNGSDLAVADDAPSCVGGVLWLDPA